MPSAPFRLAPEDADRYMRLRRRMLAEAPWAFSATPEDDVGLDRDFLVRSLGGEESAVFAVEGGDDGRQLLAVAGIVRATPAKFAHRARVFGVFVERGHRGRGLGRAVMTASLDRARAWEGVDWVDLAVSENAPEALRLYERLGFVAWGREPEATAHDGRRYDEIHMTLRLRRPAGPTTVLSGGQTGVDRAALRAAEALGLAIGGWCPPGRASESGPIPARFPLRETPSERSPGAPDVPRSLRTEWNVRDADATLVLRPAAGRGTAADADPGTDWALRCAARHGQPLLVADPHDPTAAGEIAAWLASHAVATLNVAGPGESTVPGIEEAAFALLVRVLAPR